MSSVRPLPFDPEPASPGRLWRDRLIGCALLVLLVLGRLIDLSPLTALRLWVSDAVLDLRPAASQPPSVVVVDIDDESLTALGQWPWPRDVLGRVVDKLADAGAAVVVLDMLLAEADRMSPARQPGTSTEATTDAPSGMKADHDSTLAAAMRRSVVVSGAAALGTSLPTSDRDPFVSRFAIRGTPLLDLVPQLSALVRPLPIIERASQGVGAINLYPDMDGVVRTVPGVLVTADTRFPAWRSRSPASPPASTI